MSAARLARDLLRMSEEVRAAPPWPLLIRAHHAVPLGRAHRQYMTDGRLVVWVNPGNLTDLSWRRGRSPRDALLGVPVRFEAAP